VTGRVVALYMAAKHKGEMSALPEVRAVEDHGLEGDRYAKPRSRRQVLLFEAEVLRDLDLPPGSARENILIEGFPLMGCPVGTRLRLGEAVLELTEECEPCRRLEEVRPGLRELLDGRRGMLARVFHGGRIAVGDSVVVAEPVALPIEDHLDLHTFSPREIPSVVEEYLAQAARSGYQEVRLIHGKGKGAQRAIVRAVLASHPLVAHYADAPPERGGWGATVVFLRGRG
jgi:MOSC domain-containing protein YiiM